MLYRAGDCFVNNDDRGFGSYDSATGAISCVGATNGPNGTRTPNSRVQQFMPVTAGSRYIQSLYNTVWNAVTSRQPFPNTCACTTYQDNGAGLSWSFSVSALSPQTRSNLLTFSPIPMNPVTTAVTTSTPQVSPGGVVNYSIAFTNPNAAGATLTSITNDLPASEQMAR